MKKRIKNVLCLVITCAMICVMNVQLTFAANGLKIHVINVGGADSLLIECNGEVVLIDGGYATQAQRKDDDSLKNGIDEVINQKLVNQSDKKAFMDKVKETLKAHPENEWLEI